MAVFLKTSLSKILGSNLRTTNQLRYYARWSHRVPRRVSNQEVLDKIEQKHQETSNKNAQKSYDHNEEQVIELNPETDFVKTKLEPERKFSAESREFKTKRSQAQQTKVKHAQSQGKWAPKSLQPQTRLIDMDEVDKKSEPIQYKIKSNPAKKKIQTYKTTRDIPQGTIDMLETVIDEKGDFIYTKLSDNDPTVGQLLITVKSRGEQIKNDLALLEGKRLIKEALQANCMLKTLIFSRKNDVEYLKPYLPKIGAKIYKIPYREIQMWSDLTTTPGIMGIFKTPAVESFVAKHCLELTIICDNIREPGNLGAVLRTAAGVGAQSVILTKGCVDLWDTKVLRSACGAHFRLQIHKKMDWPAIASHLNDQMKTVLVADNNIVMENFSLDVENEGTSPEPSSNEVVAALTDVITSLPLLPYYGVNFGELGHLVLIVGGETEGVSADSYRFAANFNGIRLNIPLSNNVESLNTGTALGVIMFEIKRQLTLLQSKNKDTNIAIM